MREQAPVQPVARKPKQEKKSASKKRKEEREQLFAFYVFQSILTENVFYITFADMFIISYHF